MKKALSHLWSPKRWGTLLVGLFLSITLTYGQSVISGKVSDDNGDPIPGVNVLIKGSTSGTVTDAFGNYSINAASDDILVFSFVGYISQEVVVGSQTSLDVTMAADVQQLQEVVVTGYATQDKKDLTGSVGVVDPEELRQLPTGNVTSQLQGRIAGVTVTGDSRPGASAKVRIRGFGSFGNNNPLYVVDGVPTQDISTINPEDIESLSVLKDAGAASIYGSRASNGVIVITTKKGSDGIRVNYSMYAGQQFAGEGPDNLTNTQQFADLQWLVYNNDGTDEVHPIYGPSPAAGGGSPQLPSWAADTDWWDETTRNALLMNHDVSLQGGNENAKFYAGFNWFKSEGITITNFQERFAGRFNSEFNIKDRVTVGQNLTVTYRTGLGINANGSEATPVGFVNRMQSIIPSIVTEPINGISHNFQPGDFGGTGIAPRLGNSRNEVANYLRRQDNRQEDTRLLGSVYADVKIIEGLNFRTTFGGTMQNFYNTNWNGATYENAENVATSSYSESGGYNRDWVWTNTLTFDKTFGASKILAVLGYESVKYDIGRGNNAASADFFSDAFAFRTVSNGANILSATSYFVTPTTLASTFLRADYSYNDKYLLSATVRRDGSSRFGEDDRYGVFPSVSAGWRISDEAFLANSSVITELKIRGGWGTMGNQLNLNPANQFNLYGSSPNTSFYDLNGTGSSSLQGFRPTRIGNPNAKWETNVTTNVGFDAGLFDNKFEIVFDWYNKRTEDLLFTPELNALYGRGAAPAINIAEMKNTGVDLQLIYRNTFGSDFRFEGNLTFTTYKNEILALNEGQEFFDSGDGTRIGSFNRNEVGRSLGEFFGYNVIGLFQNDAEVQGAPTQDGAEPGFFRYEDVNGDGEITPDDRTYLGDPNPDFTFGLNLAFGWRNFDLTAYFYSAQGADIFNYNKWWTDFWPSFQGIKSTDLLERSWTPENPNTSVPKASNVSNFSTNTQSVSYYVEDASFFRLKNLQVGYTFSPSLINNIGLTNLRIYLQGVNLFTITDYSGLDPELTTFSDLNPGVDEFNNPALKSFLVGLNIGF